MGFSVLSLPEEIASLSPSDLREVEDFTRDAIHLVLGGQFPNEAYESDRDERGGNRQGQEGPQGRRR